MSVEPPLEVRTELVTAVATCCHTTSSRGTELRATEMDALGVSSHPVSTDNSQSPQIPDNNPASRLTVMKQLRPISTMVCLVASFVAHAGEEPTAARAKAAESQPIPVELQCLQGRWEGVMAGDKTTSKKPAIQRSSERKPAQIGLEFLGDGALGSPRESLEKITITITGNSLHFHRDTNFWFETTFALPVGTDPKQLHAVIKESAPGQESSVGKEVVAIYKIEDGTLTLVALAGGAEETPKSFEDSELKALSRYELRRTQPQTKNTQPPKTK